VSKVHRDHVSRPTVRVTGEEGRDVTPYDVDLFTRLDVTILDTLEDLDGPAGADRPEPAHSDELQEQRLAGVVAG
jgi:hypothetical protein